MNKLQYTIGQPFQLVKCWTLVEESEDHKQLWKYVSVHLNNPTDVVTVHSHTVCLNNPADVATVHSHTVCLNNPADVATVLSHTVCLNNPADVATAHSHTVCHAHKNIQTAPSITMHMYTHTHTHLGVGGAPQQTAQQTGPSVLDQRLGELEDGKEPFSVEGELSQEEGTIMHQLGRNTQN